MNEKKTIKISLSTFFLIIAIIVIIVMGIYIYKISVEKIREEENVEILNSEVTKLEGTVSSLKEKLNLIANTVNSNTNAEIENSKTNNEEVKFSKDEIKKSLQNYLDLVGIGEGSTLGMLVKLELCDYNDYDNANKTNDNYVKTNIKYADYKAKMLEYVTEDWFNTRFKNSYKEQEGLLYYFDGGASGMQFEVKDITVKGDYSDLAYIAEVYNINFDDSKELENVEFHIENSNGKCVISYCD